MSNTTNETMDYAILNDGYKPTEQEVQDLAREVWGLRQNLLATIRANDAGVLFMRIREYIRKDPKTTYGKNQLITLLDQMEERIKQEVKNT